MGLDDLFLELDQLGEDVSLERLTEGLAQVRVDVAKLQDHIVFSDDGYRRNRFHQGPGYEALLLCWKAGQRSPIHDHQGSACGVLVLKGTATETTFARGGDGLAMLGSRTLHAGQVCGSEDADIHDIANEDGVGRNLVTLHVYAPPLRRYRIYSRTDGASREIESVAHDQTSVTV